MGTGGGTRWGLDEKRPAMALVYSRSAQNGDIAESAWAGGRRSRLRAGRLFRGVVWRRSPGRGESYDMVVRALLWKEEKTKKE